MTAEEMFQVARRAAGDLRTREGHAMLAESIGTSFPELCRLGELAVAIGGGEGRDPAFFVTLGIEVGLVLANEAWR